jgi:hypothetical protein
VPVLGAAGGAGCDAGGFVCATPVDEANTQDAQTQADRIIDRGVCMRNCEPEVNEGINVLPGKCG